MRSVKKSKGELNPKMQKNESEIIRKKTRRDGLLQSMLIVGVGTDPVGRVLREFPQHGMLPQASHEADHGLQPGVGHEPLRPLLGCRSGHQLHEAVLGTAGRRADDPSCGLVQIHRGAFQRSTEIRRRLESFAPQMRVSRDEVRQNRELRYCDATQFRAADSHFGRAQRVEVGHRIPENICWSQHTVQHISDSALLDVNTGTVEKKHQNTSSSHFIISTINFSLNFPIFSSQDAQGPPVGRRISKTSGHGRPRRSSSRQLRQLPRPVVPLGWLRPPWPATRRAPLHAAAPGRPRRWQRLPWRPVENSRSSCGTELVKPQNG